MPVGEGAGCSLVSKQAEVGNGMGLYWKEGSDHAKLSIFILRAMRSHQEIFKQGCGVIIFEVNTLTTV